MGISSVISNSMRKLPLVEGPVPVTHESSSFCSMLKSRQPLNVQDYGYTEEEYFLSSTANIYNENKSGAIYIKHASLPYINRVLVRRPKPPKSFSGRVYIDILNASQLYDIEDLWNRSYLWIMENGHGYIGLTSKPVCVQSLKNYDYKRYKSLDWTGSTNVAKPTPFVFGSIPGTEEGLVWDMIGQTASLVRTGKEHNLFAGAPIHYMCLTGQSQSGIYLNTFMNIFHKYISKPGYPKLFDGYMNIVGVPYQKMLCQAEDLSKTGYVARRQCEIDTPVIYITSEGDLEFFTNMSVEGAFVTVPKNSDTKHNKSRYFEVAAAPHTDINCPILASYSEIEKTGRPVRQISKEIMETLNDIPLAYYINGLLEKLYIWAEQGHAPRIVAPIEKDKQGNLVRDNHGNVKGGVRSPFVDVPVARYNGCNIKYAGGISGDMVWFTKEEFFSLYGDTESYLSKFADCTYRQLNEGWLCKSDAERMISWSRRAASKYVELT